MQVEPTTGTCSEASCEKPVKAHGMCPTHYHKWWRAQNPDRIRAYAEKGADRQKEYQRQRYLANREQILAREREKYGTPEYRERKREAARRWRADHVEEDRERSRRWRIQKVYGLTVEEYDAILARGCAICGSHAGRIVGKRNNSEPPPPRLCIDHDHANGKVRDALCHNCNSGLGLFGDEPARLRFAAKYLESHATPKEDS